MSKVTVAPCETKDSSVDSQTGVPPSNSASPIQQNGVCDSQAERDDHFDVDCLPSLSDLNLTDSPISQAPTTDSRLIGMETASPVGQEPNFPHCNGGFYAKTSYFLHTNDRPINQEACSRYNNENMDGSLRSMFGHSSEPFTSQLPSMSFRPNAHYCNIGAFPVCSSEICQADQVNSDNIPPSLSDLNLTDPSTRLTPMSPQNGCSNLVDEAAMSPQDSCRNLVDEAAMSPQDGCRNLVDEAPISPQNGCSDLVDEVPMSPQKGCSILINETPVSPQNDCPKLSNGTSIPPHNGCSNLVDGRSAINAIDDCLSLCPENESSEPERREKPFRDDTPEVPIPSGRRHQWYTCGRDICCHLKNERSDSPLWFLECTHPTIGGCRGCCTLRPKYIRKRDTGKK